MLCMIAACDRNRVIGKEGGIPWNIPEDLARFKELTLGHTLIMGRVTYESIAGRLKHPLLQRFSVVVSAGFAARPEKLPFYDPALVKVAATWEEALTLALEHSEGGDVFVAGGESIYRVFMPMTERIFLTQIDSAFEGDRFFPELADSEWHLVKSEKRIDSAGKIPFSFDIFDSSGSRAEKQDKAEDR